MALERKEDFTRENIIKQVLKFEGGYVNNPKDPGGETNLGITKNTAIKYKHLWSKYNFDGNMRQLPLELAVEIYIQGFWKEVRGDDILKVHPMLAFHVFDFAVNSGPSRPITRLQARINKASLQGKRWKLLKEDGKIGNGTVEALNTCANVMGYQWINNTFVKDLIDGHEQFYRTLVEKNPNLRGFLKGWLNRLNHKREIYQRVFC